MNQSRGVENTHKDIPPQCGKTSFMKDAHLRKAPKYRSSTCVKFKNADHKCMLEAL